MAAGVAALGLAAPASASRPRAEYASINSYIPARIDPLIGFTPSHGLPPVLRVRVGGRAFNYAYLNSAVVWPESGLILRTLFGNAARGAERQGAFADRPLTVRERSRLVERLDLGRDADVLVVAPGNPACSEGLTTREARGIARGTIRRWSQVVRRAPGQPDAIAVRVQADNEGFKTPRWGVTDARRFARGSRGARDGGLSLAARGDRAVAALTSWSQARSSRAGICAVPIDGVAPTDRTVFSLRYRPAFKITYVIARRVLRLPVADRAPLLGFVDWLRGPEAARQFRARGMMLTADGPPPEREPQPRPQPQPEPPDDGAQPVETPPPGAVPVDPSEIAPPPDPAPAAPSE